MTTYIVEGRYDCPQLARCQLLADRLEVLVPSVSTKFKLFEPQEFRERLAYVARSFPALGESANASKKIKYK